MHRNGFENCNTVIPVSKLNLLAIDTSTSSMVLGLKKGDIVIDRTALNVRTHSREILLSISSLLAEAELQPTDLDGIVFGQGPGSFTGLRISVGIVQGLAYGADLRVIPVSSMAAVAQGAVNDEGSVLVALSARLEEFYYGTYELSNGLVTATSAECVRNLSELDLPFSEGCILVTDVPHLWQKISKSLDVHFSKVSSETLPTVHNLLKLGINRLSQGGAISALEASPVYLREQVVRL